MIRKSGKPDFEKRGCRAGALAQERIEQKRPLLARRSHRIALGVEARFLSDGLRGRRGIRRRTGGSRHLGRSSSDRWRGRRPVRGRRHRRDGRSGRQFGSAVAPARRQSKARDHDGSKRHGSASTHARESRSPSPCRRDEPGPRLRRGEPRFAAIKRQRIPQGLPRIAHQQHSRPARHGDIVSATSCQPVYAPSCRRLIQRLACARTFLGAVPP